MRYLPRDADVAAGRLLSASSPRLIMKAPMAAVDVVATGMRALWNHRLTARLAGPVRTQVSFLVAADDGDQWVVSLDDHEGAYAYPSKDEALRAACTAAEAMHRRHHTPAVVRLSSEGRVRDVVAFRGKGRKTRARSQ